MTSLKPRWFHASTLLNTTLYISGGTTKDSAGLESTLSETIALDFSQSWPVDRPMIFTALPQLTIPLTGHSMSVVPSLNHILVVGGESTGNQTLEYILLLDPLANGGAGWRVPSIPTASSIPSSTTSLSPVATLPPKTSLPSVIPSPPQTDNNLQYLHRSYHAVITTGKDGILLQGGYQIGTTAVAAAAPVNRTIPTIVSSLVTLNPSSGFAPQISVPVSVAPNAPALARHTMTLTTDGRAIILGGINPQGLLVNLTSAHVMDTQSAEASWKEVPLLGKPPDPRMAFSTVMVNSTTLLLYGGTDDFKSAFWVTFYLDLPTWTWSSPVAQGTIPRRWGHTATMVGKTMVVMFGLSSHQTPDSTPVVLLDTTTNTWISRYTPSDQMVNPGNNNNPTTGGKKSGLSLIAVLGIGFVVTAGLVIGVFCLLVRQKKRRTRNTLARENMRQHVPRDAIRKQQQGGANPTWGILGRAVTRLGFGSSSGTGGGGGYRPESRRLSAISPQEHPMSIAAKMTQLGHSPLSLGYPEMVVEHGTGMVPVSSYVYPNQPLADSEFLARPAPAAARVRMSGQGRSVFARARRDEEDGYGALVVYHELSPAQKEALSLSQGK
ncbi:Adagio protein 3 [Mortierella hygrophila]|uniref:Adagio protein 3 n=1 Tax=Mortierella hygrophila TaxID=979708 RepID=A0A9P6F4R4_9FUNG|nr:Adagio protein 3 [Mortierella hygrophila]